MADNTQFTGEEGYSHVMDSPTIEDFKTRLRAYHCVRCNLSQEIAQNPTTSRGNTKSSIMLVGEAPGHNEMLQGIPFVGKAGRLMDEIFASAGILTDRDVYVTNICRCRPKDNRAPHVSEASTCISYLQKEIKLLKPKYIIALGATSARYLLEDSLPGKSMAEAVGRFYEAQDYPTSKFFVLYHPAALIYNRSLRPEMDKHIQLLLHELNQSKS
ncbi:MAG: uracil-DNA glycosylase [Spirochaetota bacterium]|nr:uracil-DNA glycosylase [Spirochaetota bacterium]